MNRPNLHGRRALLAAEQRARLAIQRRQRREAVARAAAEADERRRLFARAQERAALLSHLTGPRLLTRNEPARLAALLAGTNEPDAGYERWDRS